MLPYLIIKNGRNIHLKDKDIPMDVKFGDKMPHSQNESKLVIHHVSFLTLRMF